MDKFLALDLLHLGPDATQNDAKKAYRQLAKACHPDRFASDPKAAARAEEQMKQLNAAVAFLVPRLPEAPDLPARPKDQPAPARKKNGFQKQGFFSGLRQRFRMPGKKDTGSTPRNPARGTVPGPQPGARAKSGQARTSFDAVLKRAKTGSPMPPKRRPASYEAYARYLKARQQIRARQQARNLAGSRVEKVSPVDPVKPMGGG